MPAAFGRRHLFFDFHFYRFSIDFLHKILNLGTQLTQWDIVSHFGPEPDLHYFYMFFVFGPIVPKPPAGRWIVNQTKSGSAITFETFRCEVEDWEDLGPYTKTLK